MCRIDYQNVKKMFDDFSVIAGRHFQCENPQDEHEHGEGGNKQCIVHNEAPYIEAVRRSNDGGPDTSTESSTSSRPNSSTEPTSSIVHASSIRPTSSIVPDYTVIEFPKIMKDLLEVIHTTTGEYRHVHLNHIERHGCWCSKLTAGRSANGGKESDDYDGHCRDWFKQRHCMVLDDGGPCASTASTDFNSYPVQLVTHVSDVLYLSESIDVHCGPSAAIQDSNIRHCALTMCRVDYQNVKKMFDDFSTIAGQHVECENPQDEHEPGEGGHNKCTLHNEAPYVEITRRN